MHRALGAAGWGAAASVGALGSGRGAGLGAGTRGGFGHPSLAHGAATGRSPGTAFHEDHADAPVKLFTPPRLDAHAHLSSVRATDWINRLAGEGSIQAMDAEALLANMNDEGIERGAGALHRLYVRDRCHPGGPDARRGTGGGTGRERLLCGAVHPELGTLDSVLQCEPQALLGQGGNRPLHRPTGTRGVKFHFWNSVVDLRGRDSLNDLTTLFGHIADRNLPCVVHVFNGAMQDFGPDDVERFVDRVVAPHSNLRISFAHIGGAGGTNVVIRDILRRLSQVAPPDSELGSRILIDIAAVMFTERFKTIAPTARVVLDDMAELLDGWGPERVLWGSDIDPRLRRADGGSLAPG